MGTLDPKEFAPLAGEAKKAKLEQIAQKYRGNAASNQRSRLLEGIHHCPVSTFDARRHLDVPHPAGRIMELRRCGWIIHTIWTRASSDCGEQHRIAVYVFGGRVDE
jgi:hypothetical protein